MTANDDTHAPVLELKGRMMTLTVLQLLHPSVEKLANALDRRMEEAPDFFRQLPLILDVEPVADSDLYLDLAGLVGLLRAREFLPVGIRGGDERWARAAEEAGIGVFSGGSEAPASGRRNGGSGEASAPPDTATGMLVTQPVRSGQQVYARGRDLIILSSVSPGAEVLADGHIHIYGSLNGRALAGVRGDAGARILCQSFDAELVSVAGTYRVSEQFAAESLGQSVQVRLDGEELVVERLQQGAGGRAVAQ